MVFEPLSCSGEDRVVIKLMLMHCKGSMTHLQNIAGRGGGGGGLEKK